MASIARRWQTLAAIVSLTAAFSLPPALHARSTTGGDAVSPAEAGTQLRAAASRYRQLAKDWHPLDAGPPLRAGDSTPRVNQLRRMLQLYGDYRGLPGPLSANAGKSNRFDSGLQRAVERYQLRHGIEPSGIAGHDTLMALAVPPAERAEQLEINAVRWEKLSPPTSERYVLINVPAYELQLIEQGRVKLQMKTVVGKTSSRTPDLRSRITNVVFNPTWTVPRSILLTELLPKARNNPEAMHKRGYRVVNYGSGSTAPISADGLSRAADGGATLRQVSGPGNTLGRVKFIIPNKQAIFLHDTQAQSLFDHEERAFSHGCIRLEQPEELAYALLEKQGWDRTRVAEATIGDESLNIRVDKPPRLLITYITAWIDSAGRAHFRRDIYHRDEGTSDRSASPKP